MINSTVSRLAQRNVHRAMRKWAKHAYLLKETAEREETRMRKVASWHSPPRPSTSFLVRPSANLLMNPNPKIPDF